MDNYNNRLISPLSLIEAIALRLDNMARNGDFSDAMALVDELNSVLTFHTARYQKRLEDEAARISRKMEIDSDLPF